MNSTEIKNELSRRDMLITGGKIAAGAAIASMAVLNAADKSDAYENASAAVFKYAKLDPHEVGQIAYENYFKRWCASSVIAGLVEPKQLLGLPRPESAVTERDLRVFGKISRSERKGHAPLPLYMSDRWRRKCSKVCFSPCI